MKADAVKLKVPSFTVNLLNIHGREWYLRKDIPKLYLDLKSRETKIHESLGKQVHLKYIWDKVQNQQSVILEFNAVKN